MRNIAGATDKAPYRQLRGRRQRCVASAPVARPRHTPDESMHGVGVEERFPGVETWGDR